MTGSATRRAEPSRRARTRRCSRAPDPQLLLGRDGQSHRTATRHQARAHPSRAMHAAIAASSCASSSSVSKSAGSISRSADPRKIQRNRVVQRIEQTAAAPGRCSARYRQSRPHRPFAEQRRAVEGCERGRSARCCEPGQGLIEPSRRAGSNRWHSNWILRACWWIMHARRPAENRGQA